jgi:hypothetical protein
MQPRVVHHDGGLDVCLLRLEDEAAALRRMKEQGLELEPLKLSEAVPGAGQASVDVFVSVVCLRIGGGVVIGQEGFGTYESILLTMHSHTHTHTHARARASMHI